MSLGKGVVIISGATKGLGLELAVQAYCMDYPLALIARNMEDLEKLRLEIMKSDSPLISVHAVDLSDAAKTSSVFKEIAEKHKKIFALVNCAATWTGGKKVKELSANDMLNSLQLNFFSAFNPIQSMLSLPLDIIQKPASIVNVGATASLRGSKSCSAFAVAKGALRQLSQSLARELGPEGIHVAHLIIDGLIDNPRTRKLNPNIESEKFINPTSIANSILHVIHQERSCWTFEWDIRPFNESW